MSDAAFTCRHVLSGEPGKALYFSPSVCKEDSGLQYLCGKPHAAKDAVVVSRDEIYALIRKRVEQMREEQLKLKPMSNVKEAAEPDAVQRLRDFVSALRGRKAPDPVPPPKKPEGPSAAAVVAPTATLAATGLGYAGSKALDRRLTAAGLATEMPGARMRDVVSFLKSVPRGSPAGVINYAETSSRFLNRDIAKGVNGLQLLKVIGNAMYRAGTDVGKVSPLLGGLSRRMKGMGAHFRADYRHPHFNGFSTSGDGIRTLITEKANWGGMSLENMGHIARESLEANGWKATPKAARMFDRKFRDLIRQGYGFTPFRNSTKDTLPILEEIVRAHPTATDAQSIARTLAPGADISKSLYDAVKPSFTGNPNARKEVAAISKNLAGRLALLATTGTSRRGALQHGGEILGLNVLKALRSSKFRRGGAAAGAVGTAALLYNLYRQGRGGAK